MNGISSFKQEGEKEPDVECRGCGKLLPISEVEHIEREGIEPDATPRYFCKSCTEELSDSHTKRAIRYMKQHPDYETNNPSITISDIIADLKHYADEVNIDFDERMEMAELFYQQGLGEE